MIDTAQQIGGAVGVAVTSSVSISHLDHLLAAHGPSYFPQAFTAGSQWAFWVCAGIAVAGLGATRVLVRPEELAQVESAAAAA